MSSNFFIKSSAVMEVHFAFGAGKASHHCFSDGAVGVDVEAILLFCLYRKLDRTNGGGRFKVLVIRP